MIRWDKTEQSKRQIKRVECKKSEEKTIRRVPCRAIPYSNAEQPITQSIKHNDSINAFIYLIIPRLASFTLASWAAARPYPVTVPPPEFSITTT